MSELIYKVNSLAMDKVKSLVAGYLAEVAATLLEQTKKECPVKTGQLKESLKVAGIDEKNLKAYVSSNLDYLPLVELGTRKKDPNPFMDRALRNIGL